MYMWYRDFVQNSQVHILDVRCVVFTTFYNLNKECNAKKFLVHSLFLQKQFTQFC